MRETTGEEHDEEEENVSGARHRDRQRPKLRNIFLLQLALSLFSTPRAPARSLFFPFNLLVAAPSNVFFHCLVDHPPKCRALGGWLAVCAPVLHLCQQTAQPAPLLLHKILHFCPWHRGRGVQALLRPTCTLNLFLSLSPTRPASCSARPTIG